MNHTVQTKSTRKASQTPHEHHFHNFTVKNSLTLCEIADARSVGITIKLSYWAVGCSDLHTHSNLTFQNVPNVHFHGFIYAVCMFDMFHPPVKCRWEKRCWMKCVSPEKSRSCSLSTLMRTTVLMSSRPLRSEQKDSISPGVQVENSKDLLFYLFRFDIYCYQCVPWQV